MSILRHRQLLLSLKYGTIESCFSVPMLQLTLGHMPFAIGFAVTALGWDAGGVGFLAATPFLGYVLQVPISFVLQRHYSWHAIVRGAFVANAAPWFLVLSFPYVAPSARDGIFAAVVLLSALANAVCAVAWSASMSELVPLRVRGRYFGRRNLIYGFWTLLVLVAVGQIADWTNNSLSVLAAVYAAAAVSRLIGLFFFMRMTFPRTVMDKHHETMALGGLVTPLKDGNFLLFLAFHGLFGLFLFVGLPFYSVFVLTELRFTLGGLTVLTTLGNLAGLLSVGTWGPLTDRFGVKPVMTGVVILWTTTASILWLFACPERAYLAYPSFIVYGFMWTLMQLLQFTFMLKMVPAGSRAHYISTYYATTYVLTLLGPFLGGRLLASLPDVLGTLFDQPLTRYHAVLVGSLVMCLATVFILRIVSEPRAGSLREMVRHMSSRTEFNPFLMLAAAFQGLFGGRVFETALREARRTFRRQAGALAGVGQELMEGSWRALRQPFRKRDDDADTPVSDQ
ncbi:MAG: MFS transporter [Vicinamibacteria bacterium]|nr:MFS transporter [Vicinamibacteria bacterium]